MFEKIKESVTTALFCINEAEVEVGKLSSPHLSTRSRQELADKALKSLKGVKEELAELLAAADEEDTDTVEENTDDMLVIDDGEDS